MSFCPSLSLSARSAASESATKSPHHVRKEFGWAALGYDIKDRKLVVNEAEATIVRTIFERFAKLGSGTTLVQLLGRENVRNKRGKPIDKGMLYRILNNRVYLGEAVHKGTAYPGEHRPIVRKDLWDKVHDILTVSPRKRAGTTRAQTPAFLKGLLYGPTGAAMTPTHTRRRGKLYRYYISTNVLKTGAGACPIGRVQAAQIESMVIAQVRTLLCTPEIVVATWRATRRSDKNIAEEAVREALLSFDELWEELFPAEQARIIQLLVQRVDIGQTETQIRLRTEGLVSLLAELRATAAPQEAA